MPSPLGAYTMDFRPFPTQLRASEDGEGVPAFTVFESFAKEETVVMVEARPHWEVGEGEEPVDALFDVVAAYTQDGATANPATSLASVRVAHGTTRRFLVGIPGGHKLVVYPAEAGRTLSGAAHDSFLTATVVDYWA